MLKSATLAIALMAAPLLPAAEAAAAPAAAESKLVDWASWRAGNDVRNMASLQRGARNFINYCLGCHSLKYMRYSRMAEDLHIRDGRTARQPDPDRRQADRLHADHHAGRGRRDLVRQGAARPVADRARARRGLHVPLPQDLLRRPGRGDGLEQPAARQLGDARGAVGPRGCEARGVPQSRNSGRRQAGDGKGLRSLRDHGAGRLDAAQYDGFVRDTVNFLDYVGEPSQAARVDIGIWVVLFLLVFTWLAWLLKQEYWKDVH